MKAVITNITYSVDNNELKVYLHGRAEDRRRVSFILKGTQPHFYVPQSTNVPKIPEIISVEAGYKSIFGLPLKRINVDFPYNVPRVREGLDHYEADILYEYRVRYDYGIKGQVILEGETVTPSDSVGDVLPKFAFMDIEVDNSHGGWTPDVAEGEVLSIAIYDLDFNICYVLLNTQPHPMRSNFPDIADKVSSVLKENKFPDYKIKIIYCNGEKELLTIYKKYLTGPHAPDVLVAWNGWNYDFPYLEKRFKKNKIQYPPGMSHFDFMFGYATLYRTHHGELESNSLQTCANKELGTGKLNLSGEPIYSLYRNDVSKFTAYNIVDVILMYEMNKKSGVLKHYQTLSEISGVTLDNINMETRIVENMIIFMLKGTRTVLPSIPRHMKGEEFKGEGAEVLEPVKGIFNNVVVFDLKGEYPNIMRSFNLSPETIYSGMPTTDSFKLPFGTNTHTIKNVRGVLPKILDNMMNLRDEMKKEMKKYAKGTTEFDIAFSKQEAFKWVMNSVAGVLGNEHFRLANRVLFNNVTGIGRLHVKWTAEQARNMGLKVLYGDTDSVMVQMIGEKSRFDVIDVDGKVDDKKSDYENIIKKSVEIEKLLNESYLEFIKQFNAKESLLHVDLKKLYSKWFQGGKKKRYAGVIVWDGGKYIDPLIEITGFDAKRSSSPPYARKIQKELLWRLLTEDVKNVETFIKECYNDIKNNKIPIEDLGVPIRMSSEEYKGNPIHYRAVVYSNMNMGTDFGAGAKIKYYYVKSIKGKPQTDVVAFDVDAKVPDGVEINMDEHIRRCFELPLGPIVEAIGLKLNEVIGKKKTVSLMQFV